MATVPQTGGDSETRDKLLGQIRLVSQTLFAQEAVKQLRESDFALDSKARITLKWEDCTLVLFYVNNNESTKLAEIWSIAAQQIAGPIFAACNLLVERKVAEAFTKLNTENTALHWAALKSLPFILVYQNGWPVAFYNGERAVQPIIDYALTLACNGGYREEIQIAGGITVKEDYEMGGYYQYSPARSTSSQYTTTAPIRRFNENIPVVLVGSPAEQQLASSTSPLPSPPTFPPGSVPEGEVVATPVSPLQR